jgi:HAD superfamily 5'-nucleotidase-like hydrolase
MHLFKQLAQKNQKHVFQKSLSLSSTCEFQKKEMERLVDNCLAQILVELDKTKNLNKKMFCNRYLFGTEGEEGIAYHNHVFGTSSRQLNLSNMQAIGFDYDYTLANYNGEIQPLIYSMAVDYMIEKMNYPSDLKHFRYDPNFAIRGLYFDTKKGNLVKMDYLHNLQVDSVYRGRQPLSIAQIEAAYGGTHINSSYVRDHFRPMIDNFSLPEACLISDTIEYFSTIDMSFEPGYVYSDVCKAIGSLHLTGLLHNAISQDIQKYLNGERPLIRSFLERIRRKKQKLFLCTNSPLKFVDVGMKLILGNSWRELFDVVIVSADKPNWFTTNRHFRRIGPDGGVFIERISNLEPGEIYTGGSMSEFHRLTGIDGHKVLYLGDHLFSDIAEPSQISGWRTGMIVSELAKEIEEQNKDSYKENLQNYLILQSLKRKLDLFKAETKELDDVMHQFRIGKFFSLLHNNISTHSY